MDTNLRDLQKLLIMQHCEMNARIDDLAKEMRLLKRRQCKVVSESENEDHAPGAILVLLGWPSIRSLKI